VTVEPEEPPGVPAGGGVPVADGVVVPPVSAVSAGVAFWSWGVPGRLTEVATPWALLPALL
jgi:hypothetical protein